MKDFEKFLADLSQETKDIVAIANLSGGNYSTMKDIPTNELKIAVEDYRRKLKTNG